jgi:hypothetical protein
LSAPRRKRVRVAAIFGGAFRVWFTTLPQLLLVATLANAPLVALRLYARGEAAPDSARGVTARALPILDLAVSAATEAFAVLLVLRRLRGEPPAPLRSVRAGARRLGTVLGITAILNAPNGMNAALDLFSLQARVAPRSQGLSTPWGVVPWWDLAFGGFTLLVRVFLCGPIPVAVVERRGVFASIGRSWILARGNRLPITAAFLLLILVAEVAAVPIDLLHLPATGDARLALDVVGKFVVASFVCIVPIVSYREVIEAREGAGSEQLATVFH